MVSLAGTHNLSDQCDTEQCLAQGPGQINKLVPKPVNDVGYEIDGAIFSLAFSCSDLAFSSCSPSCFEARCVWMWRRRRQGRCVNERPVAEETTVGTWGATTGALEVREASWEVEWCASVTGGDHHLEAAWPPNLAWAPEEALAARERVASRPSAAEKSTTCSVEVVPCSSSSTVLVNEKEIFMYKRIYLFFVLFFIFCSLFALECDTACQPFVCEIDKTE